VICGRLEIVDLLSTSRYTTLTLCLAGTRQENLPFDSSIEEQKRQSQIQSYMSSLVKITRIIRDFSVRGTKQSRCAAANFLLKRYPCQVRIRLFSLYHLLVASMRYANKLNLKCHGFWSSFVVVKNFPLRFQTLFLLPSPFLFHQPKHTQSLLCNIKHSLPSRLFLLLKFGVSRWM